MRSNEVADILVESGSYVNTRHTGENPTLLPDGSTVPVYLSCRRLFSQPEYRSKIEIALTETIEESYPSTDLIVGVATAGIGWAHAVASALNMPMAYVRSGKKGYGLGGLVEGNPIEGSNAVVIDDVLFSGKSVFGASEALMEEKKITTAGYMGIVALNSEGVSEYRQRGLQAAVLTGHQELVASALIHNHITGEEADIMRKFYQGTSIY